MIQMISVRCLQIFNRLPVTRQADAFGALEHILEAVCIGNSTSKERLLKQMYVY